MRKELLNYYGDIHAGYLHAYSEAGTEFLLKELVLKKNAVVLELGFGTGCSLVKIKSRNPDIHLFGAELSQNMFTKASARLRFCGIGGVTLKKIEPNNQLPFGENTFDVVYAESVLGIQEGKNIEFMFAELYRVLKPGGQVILNETVWLEGISREEIKTLNTACKNIFGIIQANMEYPGAREWEALIRAKGFSNLVVKTIDNTSQKITLTKAEKLSRLFTLIGKIKSFNPFMRREFKGYTQTMNTLYGSKRYLEGLLFSMSK